MSKPVKITDEWVEDFAKREKISKMEAKFLLRLAVGWDNLIYQITSRFNKK